MTPSALTFVRRIAGAGKRAVLRTVDRTLHPWRRRRTLDALRRRPAPESVLFVCLGNICRSPYAENLFRSLTNRDEHAEEKRGFQVVSAGLIGPGRPSPPEMRRAAEGRDVDLDDHTSQLVTREILDRTDLVVVMDPDQARALEREFAGPLPPVLILGDLDPGTIERRTIRDPWGQAPEVFGQVADRLDRCVRALARTLAGDGRESSEERS